MPPTILLVRVLLPLGYFSLFYFDLENFWLYLFQLKAKENLTGVADFHSASGDSVQPQFQARCKNPKSIQTETITYVAVHMHQMTLEQKNDAFCPSLDRAKNWQVNIRQMECL